MTEDYLARRRRTQGRAMSGCRWTEEEDLLVIAHEIPDIVLSKYLQRSEMAIQLRRYRLGCTNMPNSRKYAGKGLNSKNVDWEKIYEESLK